LRLAKAQRVIRAPHGLEHLSAAVTGNLELSSNEHEG
jgi:hypothetical protein